MGKMTINFAEVEGGFDVMPEGRYPVVIEKVEVRESKSSEHNYLNWELTISEGDYEGRKQWMITSLSPKALFRLKDVFAALGFDVEDEENFDIDWDDDVEVTPKAGPLLTEPDVTGMAATAIITIEPYNGTDQNRVDNLVAAEDEAPRASSAKRSGGSTNGGSAAKKSTGGRRALR